MGKWLSLDPSGARPEMRIQAQIRFRERTYGFQGGGVGGCRLGIWDWHVYIAIFKIDNQQGPTA